MDNRGNVWTTDEENRMLSLLAQTRMSSTDCDTVFANMFGRSPRAIYMRRVQIAHRLIKLGHPISYLCILLHLTEQDIILSFNKN